MNLFALKIGEHLFGLTSSVAKENNNKFNASDYALLITFSINYVIMHVLHGVSL